VADFRRVTPEFWVSPQIDPADVGDAAAAGVRTILNNRPAHEPQPDPADIEAAARQHGLTYLEATVFGAPTAAEARAVADALALSAGPVLAYCASGTRSIAAWAVAQVMTGTRSREEVVGLARGAGYDLSRLL
jgi:uncharacterized protein (TIGR01244 family)